jgi:methionine-rich copper-binding protein CopC
MRAMASRRFIRVGLTMLMILAGRAGPARAHAFLDHAEPRVGSTVAASPPTLTLLFTEPVEPDFCRVAVADDAGKAITAGALQHPEPSTLAVSLPTLAPGKYTVTWAVVSVDTHPTSGHFTFTVGP